MKRTLKAHPFISACLGSLALAWFGLMMLALYYGLQTAHVTEQQKSAREAIQEASGPTVSAPGIQPQPMSTGQWLINFEPRMLKAFKAAATALDLEERRLDEMAERNRNSQLGHGRPSLGQAAANIWILERKISDQERIQRELRDKLQDILSSLGPRISER